MNTESKKVDRSMWGAGPWDDEPDRVEFEHAGLPCLLNRGPLGAWCGYAAVLPGHPWHGKDYHDVDVEAHGGLTYADKCEGSICHVPKPGEPDDVYWFGFDCAHSGDSVPGMAAQGHDLGGWYKDLAYVRRQVERLAEQLAAVKPDAHT